jgi:hypothetical protein
MICLGFLSVSQIKKENGMSIPMILLRRLSLKLSPQLVMPGFVMLLDFYYLLNFFVLSYDSG